MIKLVKLCPEYRLQLNEMMEEWTAAGEKIVPYAIRKNDFRDFETYLAGLVLLERENPDSGNVPSSTYFALDTERNIFVGAVNIRHYLDDYMLKWAGHIGDGVRPSERRRGYATEMISQALDICRQMGIDRVLMVCDKTNIGSARSIQKNGGILENEIVNDEGGVEQRYWITL